MERGGERIGRGLEEELVYLHNFLNKNFLKAQHLKLKVSYVIVRDILDMLKNFYFFGSIKASEKCRNFSNQILN